MPPPPGWVAPSIASIVLDVVYWCNRVWPVQIGGKWPLGVACRAATPGDRPVRADHPPDSVQAVITEMCASVVPEMGVPFVTADPRIPSRRKGRTIGGIAAIDCDPPAAIPVCTVAEDNAMLVWDDDAHPCASASNCVAAGMPGAPGPLPFWVPPGSRRSDYAQPAFCLLCIRADAEAIVRVYRRVISSAEGDLGRTAITLPPFQNLVGCPGGYRHQALGVRPDHFLFAPVSIAGVGFPMDVVVDPVSGVARVDQSASVWSGPQCL